MKNFIIIPIILMTLLLSSCGSSSTSKEAEAETEHHDEHENPSTAMLTDEQMKSIQIELGSIEKKQLTASLKANGILKVPNQNKASVTSLLGGVVKSILVTPGNTVSKGQVIATITNTSFVTLQENYLTTSSKVALSELEVARQKELNTGNAGTLKTYQAVESELKILKAQKMSLQKQLEMTGINASTLTSENMQSVVSITSPISGVVSDVLINIGGFVDANNPIAEIVDNSQLHLDLYVYEKDLPKMKIGQTIHFTLTNNAGKEYDADVYAISNTFEESTKAIAVHAMVKGDKSGLIDGMSISALVSLENATVDAVPTNAIVNHEGQDYIFIVTDAHTEDEHHDEKDKDKDDHDKDGHKHDEKDAHKHDEKDAHKHDEKEEKGHDEKGTTFEKIPVRKGTTDVGYSEITLLKDIPANSKVVTNGAFFILAKMNNKGEGHAH